jgi:hypothetical protein
MIAKTQEIATQEATMCLHCCNTPAARLEFMELEQPPMFCSDECAAREGYQLFLMREYYWCPECDAYTKRLHTAAPECGHAAAMQGSV